MTQVNRTNELMTVCRSSAGVPAVGAAPPGGRRGCGRGRWARFPRTKACTGGSRLWFPGLRSAFQKRPFSCGNLRGRRWVRTTGFSLVRRNQAGNLPSSQRRLIHVTCGNRAWRGPGVPGRVCTVVPASGSRTTWHRACRYRPRIPVTATAEMTVLRPCAVITHRRAADAQRRGHQLCSPQLSPSPSRRPAPPVLQSAGPPEALSESRAGLGGASRLP